MNGEVIRLQERATVSLPRSVYHALEDDSAFLELLSEGTVTLVRSRSTPFGVRAGALVGQANLGGDRRLVIDEKVPGTLRDLLTWALPSGVRDFSIDSSVDADQTVLLIFARRFLDFLARSLVRGRTKEYVRQLEVSSTPRGRIDAKATMALWARGHTGSLATQPLTLSPDVYINRLLALGLFATEVIAKSSTESSIRLRARSLSGLFEDVVPYELFRMRRRSVSEAFRRCLADPRVEGDLQKALGYAQALALHLGPWPETPTATVPDSVFVNLETLFEEAVRNVIAEVGSPLRTMRGASLGKQLFLDTDSHYTVDPDIVALDALGTPFVVADTKSKDLDGWPSHADVYQLTAHAHALGAPLAVLIYPGTSFSISRIGLTTAGTETFYCKVRTSSLAEDLSRMLQSVESR